MEECVIMVSGQFPLRKFASRLGLVLGLEGFSLGQLS